eukprot:jgi/Picre1/28135/NNA_003541.t1
MEKRTEERFPLSSDPDQAVLGNGRTTPPGEHQQDPEVGKKKLLAAESIDYLAPSSRVYKHWLAQQAWGRHWDRWLVMACIGIAMGVVGFSLHYLIHFFSFIKYHGNRWLLGHTHVLIGWMFNVSFSLALVYGSTWLVVHVAPEVLRAGVSEVMAYLNGAGSGVWPSSGPEGPMVHIGAIMAAGLSQGHSTHLGWDSGLLRRFQNPKDKRDFVTAGAAVGVATAFSAPVGGLLFMFEEVASFWQQSLGWQIFFAWSDGAPPGFSCLLAHGRGLILVLLRSLVLEHSWEGSRE